MKEAAASLWQKFFSGGMTGTEDFRGWKSELSRP
jgi:hypothetical protein